MKNSTNVSLGKSNFRVGGFQGVISIRQMAAFFFLLTMMIAGSSLGFAQEKTPDELVIVQASEEGQEAIQQFKYPENIKCELFAAEPDVANIVAFHRDYQGRMFVAETFRQEMGVEDNRRHTHWMDEELQAQTVQDRIDYIRKYIPDADESYTSGDDRIRLLLDTNGDGKADLSKVFSDKYNKLEMGTGAGVLSYGGNVYYTCIPDLFMLTDKDDDGTADVRESLHTGYGVRFAFRGHDMHGLIVGPDGRLYFSIGDRGYNISPEIKDVVSGAVFRCELDGSDLEVVCTGLRNPQELAFDDFGNLFTGDNNSDSGDMARWVYLVPGSDTGWRMYYQYLQDRGPFNRERIWYPFDKETPAYIVPPIANISDGPSGLEYYPGTGFGDEFKGRFFLCDFRGNATVSGIRSFRSKQDGAFFTLEDDDQPFWKMLATDIDFGSDGKLYMSDWVFGWRGENKGRVYAFSDPAHVNSAIVKEVESLLKEGMAKRTVEDLNLLMGHADQRVRQEAQFELVKRNDMAVLSLLATGSRNRMARIHAIWGLGQLARQQVRSGEKFEVGIIEKLIADDDFEIRAQAAQLAADAQAPLAEKIAALLNDENLRVRYYAAMSLSKIGDAECLAPIATMLAENSDADPIIRHGGIMAIKDLLRKIEGEAAVLKTAESLVQHESASVRLATCIAIRKALSDPKGGFEEAALQHSLALLLDDKDASVFVETVRAIHDVPVNALMPALAKQLDGLEQRLDESINDDAVVRRVSNANFRVGNKESAMALVRLAANSKFSEERRVDALNFLSTWMKPAERDAVLNDWRPIELKGRNVTDAQTALAGSFSKFVSESEAVASAAISAAGNLNVDGIGADLVKVIGSDSYSDTTRVASLESLNKIKFEGLERSLVNLAGGIDDLPPRLAATVTGLLAMKDASYGLALFDRMLARTGDDQNIGKQMAIATLGRMSDDQSAAVLFYTLDKVSSGNYPKELRLDVVMAAENRKEEAIAKRLAEYRKELLAYNDPSMIYTDTLYGGDAEAGKKIFSGKTEVSCVRCHRIHGTGGKVGPDLSGVAFTKEKGRQYLLESIADPNKAIAEGFAQIKIQTLDGLMVTGIVKSETENEIQLMDADENLILIAKDDIEGTKPGLSSMPDDLAKQLTPAEIRDLIEYLAGLKTPQEPAKKTEHE